MLRRDGHRFEVVDDGTHDPEPALLWAELNARGRKMHFSISEERWREMVRELYRKSDEELFSRIQEAGVGGQQR